MLQIAPTPQVSYEEQSIVRVRSGAATASSVSTSTAVARATQAGQNAVRQALAPSSHDTIRFLAGDLERIHLRDRFGGWLKSAVMRLKLTFAYFPMKDLNYVFDYTQ